MATPAALPLAQIQSSPTPLFIASIVALFSSIAGLNALTIALPGLKAFSDAPVFQFFVSTPAVIVAIAATAAYRGQAAEWWSYFEMCVLRKSTLMAVGFPSLTRLATSTASKKLLTPSISRMRGLSRSSGASPPTSSL